MSSNLSSPHPEGAEREQQQSLEVHRAERRSSRRSSQQLQQATSSLSSSTSNPLSTTQQVRQQVHERGSPSTGPSSLPPPSYPFLSFHQNMDRREEIDYKLVVRQQPKHSRMCGFAEKVDRRPIDPPPIVQLFVRDPTQLNPNSLVGVYSDEEMHLLRDGKTRSTTGSTVSSLYRLKDVDNTEGGFFVFPDLSVRMEGQYRLKFSLFELVGSKVIHCASIFSEVFSVYPAKRFPGMEESTFLSRSFGEQGLKIRIRKELRAKRRHEAASRRTSPSPADDPRDRAAPPTVSSAVSTLAAPDAVAIPAPFPSSVHPSLTPLWPQGPCGYAPAPVYAYPYQSTVHPMAPVQYAQQLPPPPPGYYYPPAAHSAVYYHPAPSPAVQYPPQLPSAPANYTTPAWLSSIPQQQQQQQQQQQMNYPLANQQPMFGHLPVLNHVFQPTVARSPHTQETQTYQPAAVPMIPHEDHGGGGPLTLPSIQQLLDKQ